MEASTTVTVSLLVIAVSTAILAIMGLVVGLGWLRVAQEVRRGLRQHGLPALEAARGAAEDLRALSGSVRDEGRDLVALSRDLRGRVEGAVEQLSDRFEDVDALFDVVYEEVESTALDVAAGLRTVRRGRSVLGRMRRALRRRR